MSPADGISKLGFRRWYERQLIESHAYLVTCFLCVIVVAAFLEGFSVRDGIATGVAAALTIFAAGAIGFGAFRRYIDLLNRAEHIAEHSVCKRCSTYGRLHVLGSSKEQRAPEGGEAQWMRVACRKCGHQWLID